MSWNYRVRKKVFKSLNGTPEAYYDIVEAHYKNDECASRNKSNGWTENSIAPGGESIEALRWQLEQMLKALNRSVIDETASERNNLDENRRN